MYKWLGGMLDDPAAVSRLLKCTTYQEVLRVFRDKRSAPFSVSSGKSLSSYESDFII